MKTCKTCCYWVEPLDREKVEDEKESAEVFGYRVRECKNPKIVFYQRPEHDGAAVCDGSEFAAELLTAEDFGCVLHRQLAEGDSS